jgi:hypothetical protein
MEEFAELSPRSLGHATGGIVMPIQKNPPGDPGRVPKLFKPEAR